MNSFLTGNPLAKGRVVFLAFCAVVAVFLIYEHTAHVLGALPFLLLLACPLMHLFMHHGSHGQHDQGAAHGAPANLDGVPVAFSQPRSHDHE